MARIKEIERLKIDNAVVDFLYEHKGKRNKVSGREIRELVCSLSERDFNYTAIAQLIRRIMIERRLPICHESGQCGGYWWAETKAELIESVENLEKRVSTMQETIGHLRSFIF